MTDAQAPTGTAVGPAATPVNGVALNLVASLGICLIAGGLLAATAVASALALLVGVAIVQAAFAVAWVFGTGMPGRKGALMLAAATATAADVTTSVWPHGRLGPLLAVLGLAVPMMFVHQLGRGTARVQIVSSLSAVALLVLAELALPALLQLRHEFLDADEGGRVVLAVVAAAAGAMVVGYLVDLVVPTPRFDPEVPRGLIALVASAVVGGCVSYLVLRGGAAAADFADGRGAFLGAALGAAAGLLAIAASFILFTTPEPASARRRLLRPAVAAIFPLCALAPAAFLLCLAVRS
ncbi:MAG TPA: hypothetical protein VGN18_11905 [Jatrophihabitans sp.]|uniref:hypothetical protein n=1 Tax=Jatrophihabitans sp. TaxID=1932789 RepID=UPI002E070506|nr:hypothetical protein [Jatrophihabitans sp.]